MPDNNEINQIEIHTDEVRELLGQIPGSIVRWGISVIAGVLVFLIAGSALFRYPDIQVAQIVLTTQNPPVNLVAKVNGKLEKLLVENKQQVKQGDFIAMLETAANLDDIKEAEKLSVQMMNSISNIIETDKIRNLQLGEIQSVFSSFIKVYTDNSNFIKLNYHKRKTQALKQESLKYDVYYKKLEEQFQAQANDCKLTLKQFKRDSILFNQGVISNSDFEKSESVFMSKVFAVKETETNLAEAKIQVSQLNQQILDLELEYDKEKKHNENQVSEVYQRLEAEIEIWKQKYLLITPIEGKINFTKFWSENQQVSEGEVVFNVIPKDTSEIIGKIKLNVEGAGKVKTGQKVNIKLANYPYIEFGMVKGEIVSVSQVPDKNFYTADVKLVNGLLTNYQIPLEFRQEMPGIAEIITEDKSLLRRIINPVKSVIKKQSLK